MLRNCTSLQSLHIYLSNIIDQHKEWTRDRARVVSFPIPLLKYAPPTIRTITIGIDIGGTEPYEFLEYWMEQVNWRGLEAALLDRPWRERIAVAAQIAREILPVSPEPALLHGDMWRGNVLVADGAVAALIDPICYYGHAEADLAMLSLFDAPPDEFWEAYGWLEPEAETRRPLYELFHAIVHMRLYGPLYGPMLDRLLTQVGA